MNEGIRITTVGDLQINDIVVDWEGVMWTIINIIENNKTRKIEFQIQEELKHITPKPIEKNMRKSTNIKIWIGV